ncbi:MAG: MFS transporter [Bacteroidaceae bacterium]|nr:MFS transporter [Bacteroidaceae bacterium]
MAKSSLKSTIAVSLNNYLDAGAIVAGASGLTLWQNYLELSEVHLGWLNFISANCLGAAIGAIIGGFLADKFGRKFIFTYNLLVYMLGVLTIMLSMNFPMLLAGFLITGISVGIGVPASWTYISESSEINNRGRNICISQMSWGVGPMFILLFGMLFAPDGALFESVKSVAGLFGTDLANEAAVNVFSSRVVFFTLFVVAFIAWTLQRQLEESAEFEASKAEAKTKGEDTSLIHAFAVLFSNKIAVKTVAFLATIYLTWNLVASVMGFFMPHVYETAGGLSNEDANMLSCVSWVFVVATTFVVSFFVDKVAHRIFYVFGLAAALTAWFLIIGGSITTIAGIWMFTILWGVNNGCSVQIFYALWGSELFPAKFRAGAQGLMFFIVRGLSAVWGLVFTYIYGENGEGFTLAAWCMIALLVISLVVGFIGAPSTRGKSLDEITKERYGDNY